MTITRLALPLALVVSLATLGCESDAGNGALIGGGVGALAGGIIGNNVGGGHHALGGALIGGAIGAGSGALIGHASDENKKDQRESYDRGYQDARSDSRSYSAPPSSGYTSYSQTTRSGVDNGGYYNSRTTTETTTSSSSYYGR